MILDRRIVVTADGYDYEPDGKHTGKMMMTLGLDGVNTKGSQLPGDKTTVEDEEFKGRPLTEEKTSSCPSELDVQYRN